MAADAHTPRSTIRVVPANKARWTDLEAIFGRGAGSRCWCQRYKLAPKESFGGTPVEERTQRLREQTDCEHPRSRHTSGLVAYLDDEPAGWCAVEPRPAYVGLTRVFRVPWEGRDTDRADPSVWAVTCLLVRAGFRRRGVSRALVAATVDFARDRGATSVEAYPMRSTEVIDEELHVGIEHVFAEAGFEVVSRPGRRRVVMQVELRGTGGAACATSAKQE